MVEINTFKRINKYGLLVTGKQETGEKKWIDGDYGDNGYYDFPKKEVKKYALKAVYDQIENITLEGSHLNFYKVKINNCFGLYYIDEYNTEYASFIEKNFEQTFIEGQWKRNCIGGFILIEEYENIEIYPDKKTYSLIIGINGKYGFLSCRGYWGISPIYDSIVKLDDKTFVVKSKNRYKILRIYLWGTTPNLKKDIQVILSTRRKRKIKNYLLNAFGYDSGTNIISELKLTKYTIKS
jgi:hypothetical protein